MEGVKIMEQKITLIDACIDFLNAGDYKKAIEVGKLAVEKNILIIC
jgi:hypothetical protein